MRKPTKQDIRAAKAAREYAITMHYKDQPLIAQMSLEASGHRAELARLSGERMYTATLARLRSAK